jgi:RsiW-degrading membrane proteinase PrsW (M82 family)
MDLFTKIAPLVLLALLPALGWVTLYRCLDFRDREPLPPTIFALLLGVISTIPVFALQYSFSSFPDFNLVSILQKSITSPLLFSILFLFLAAIIEEIVKAIAFLIVVKKKEEHFNQIVDGIIYGALVGIGFALAENIYYFSRAVETFEYSFNFLAIFSIRSFGTMLAHTLFTGIFGFYFAKAYFSPFIDETSKSEKLWHNVRTNLRQAIRLHVTFFHLLPQRDNSGLSISRNAIIFEGFFIAVLVHVAYNALIKLEIFGRNWTFLIVPLIFMVAWITWSRFFIPFYTRIVEFVRLKRDLYRVRIH